MSGTLSLVATADLHGALPDISGWPDADVLVLAGDTQFGESYSRGLTARSAVWLSCASDKYEHVLGIAGNHDFGMQSKPDIRELPWTYLCDEAIEINGFKFYGTPWSAAWPAPFYWAFQKPDPDLAPLWKKIPSDTDVLIVHGPPQGVRDRAYGGEHTGSSTLRERILKIQPKLVICGHIHEAEGVEPLGMSLVANVSWDGEPRWLEIGKL